jgi:hypothetical protein
METDWEKFMSETKNQISTFLEKKKDKGIAKHVIVDAFENEPDAVRDILATFHLIRSSNNERASAVAGLLAFLWAYEVEYGRCIDAFCYLLTENGHDPFFRQKCVHGLEEIGKVDVYTKLNFLKEHKFGLLERKEEEEIRNKIAHHDFVIDNSGKVSIKGKEVDISLKFNELTSFTHKVFMAFCSCLDKC